MMFNPAKGTKFNKILLSKASKDARETLFLMEIRAFKAHLSNIEFILLNKKMHDLCG